MKNHKKNGGLISIRRFFMNLNGQMANSIF